MAKIVYVEKDDCTSCTLCVDSVGEYFRMDEDDIAESHNNETNIQNAEIKDEDIQKVQDIMDDCPGECILWR